eukprot:s4449_g7.t1
MFALKPQQMRILPAIGPSGSEQPKACAGVPKIWQGPLAMEFSSGNGRAVLSLLVRYLRCRTLFVGMGYALLDRLFAGGAPGRLHVHPAKTAEPGPCSTQRGPGLCLSQRGCHHLEGRRWRGGVSTSRSSGLVKSGALLLRTLTGSTVSFNRSRGPWMSMEQSLPVSRSCPGSRWVGLQASFMRS